MVSASQSSTVISTYRTLAHLVRRLPEKRKVGAWKELREEYRKHADETSPEKIDYLIHEAGKKIAFLRIVTPKDMWQKTGQATIKNAASSSKTTNQAGVTRWVYSKSGKDVNGQATMRKKRQVISNYDGGNLDPCSMKRHNYHLKKLGFVNNLHAKGLF